MIHYLVLPLQLLQPFLQALEPSGKVALIGQALQQVLQWFAEADLQSLRRFHGTDSASGQPEPPLHQRCPELVVGGVRGGVLGMTGLSRRSPPVPQACQGRPLSRPGAEGHGSGGSSAPVERFPAVATWVVSLNCPLPDQHIP